VAKKTGDDIIALQGKLQVTVDEAAAGKAKKSIDKIIQDLQKTPIKMAFDTTVAEEFSRKLNKLKQQQDAVRNSSKANAESELLLINRQVKALEKLRDTSISVNRARQGYGKGQQGLVAAGAKLTDRQIAEMGKTAKGRGRLEKIGSASIARDELVAQTNRLARSLFDAGMHDIAVQVKREADRVASTGGGLSKRISAGGQQKIASAVQVANKQIQDAAIKQAEKIQQDVAKAYLKAQRVRQVEQARLNRISRGGEAFQAAGGVSRFDPKKVLAGPPSQIKAVKSYLDSQAKAFANMPREMRQYMDSLDKLTDAQHLQAKQLAQSTKDQRQLDLELANARKNAAGRRAFGAAGGLDAFDPSRLGTKADTRNVKGYLTSEIGRLAKTGDEAELLRHQKALDQLTNAHKRMNPVLQQGGALMKQFFRYAIGYQALYQALGAVTALSRSIVELDKHLFDIQAISQSTSKEMITLSGAINDVAINTKFSTQEIAEATKVLAQAGVATKDIPATLQAVADLGAATGGDLQVAADVLTTMQEVYEGLSAQQAANQLTQAVNQSKLTTEDLKTVASIGAQITASYNITSEQFLSAAAVLRNAGIRASTAATGLSQAALEVFTLDKKSLEGLSAQYHKMGEDMSDAQIKGMYAGFAQEADPLMAVLTELQRVGFGTDSSLNRLFDKRAVNVLQALISNMDELVSVQSKMNFGQPAAVGADIAMGSLSAQLDNLGSAFTALGAQITEGPVSSLKEMVKGLTKGVEALRKFDLERRAAGGQGLGAVGGMAGAALAGAAVGGIAGFSVGGVGAIPGALIGAGVGATAYGASKVYSTATASPQEKLAEQARALRQLADTTQAELDKLKAAYAAFDPESIGEHSLGESIARITDGLKGTKAEIQRANQELSGLASLVEKELDRMTDELAQATISGDTGEVARLTDVFATLQKEIPDARDILNQTGAYADPEKALEGVKSIMMLLRDTQYSMGQIADKQREVSDQIRATTEKEVASILASDNATAMLTMVEGFLSTVDMLGVRAATERLNIIKRGIEAALSQTTDPVMLASLTAQLGSVNAAIGTTFARGTEEKKRLTAGINIADLQDQAKIQAFLDSQEGQLLQQRTPGYASMLQSGMAAESAQALLANPENLQYGPGGELVPQLGSGDGTAQGMYAQVGAEAALAFARYQQAQAERAPAPLPELEYEPQTYVQSSENFKKVAELDFQIEKVKEFGGAAGELSDLLGQKNALVREEQERALAVARENAAASGSDEDKKKVAEEEIKLQKLELDARKDYIDAVTKDTDNELKAYQDRAKTIMAEGGDLTTLNTEFKSRQQDAVKAITEWGKSVGMSDERIKAEIESRGILSQALLSDKAVDDMIKSGDRRVSALEEAVPTTATTGNALLDAQSRVRGYGFTEAENADLYARQIAGKQAVIAGKRDEIAERQALLPFMTPEKQEQTQATIDAYTKSLSDLNNEVNDLYVMMGEIGTTGADQLKQAFGEESIRPYLIALEQSQNALKNWGANLRGHVLSAWEGIGDAIADSVVNGENFSDLMENLARNLAGDVLRTSAKGALNTLARNVLGNAMPGTEAQAGQAPGAAAAPAAGGILGSVASALGFGGGGAGAAATALPGAGAATGTMTVTAGVVNVNGAGQAMEKTAKDMLGGKEGKGFFGSLFDGIGNMASDAWKGITGAASGAGDMASQAASWIGTLFAAKGWVGQFAGGYVDKNGVIRGPGSGTSDSIPGTMSFAKGKSRPIRVSNKESILTEKATNYLGHNTIGALNSGKIPGFSAGRVADQSARATSGVNQDQLAPVVHVPEFPPQTLEAYIGIDSAEVVAKGLRNNPKAVRELAEINRVNRRSLTVTRN
jgi:TP901 family phage tail tape measure protein